MIFTIKNTPSSSADEGVEGVRVPDIKNPQSWGGVGQSVTISSHLPECPAGIGTLALAQQLCYVCRVAEVS
jgi:hypothetical protein